MPRSHLLALGAALAALALGAPPAGAVTFGADLSQPANATFDCTVVPPFNFSTGVNDCTWWTTSTVSGNVSQSLTVPSGGGVVKRVRVKVGPVTGPMQIVALRSIRNPASLAHPGCCFYVGESAVFTPAANGITAIDVNIPVKNEIDRATGLANYDTLGVSVLEPGVPIPAYASGDFNMGASSGALFPRMQTGQERADVAGLTGYQVLLSADLDPPAAAPATPIAAPPPVTVPAVPVVGNPVALAARRALARDSAADVPLLCRLTTACQGLLELQHRRGAAAAARRTVRYGSARFRVAAGKRGRVRVRLSRPARRLLAKRGRLRVWAKFTLGTGAARQVTGSALELRRR